MDDIPYLIDKFESRFKKERTQKSMWFNSGLVTAIVILKMYNPVTSKLTPLDFRILQKKLSNYLDSGYQDFEEAILLSKSILHGFRLHKK